MATLTDEEKVKEILGDVDPAKGDETTEPTETIKEEEQETTEAEKTEETEEEQSTEEESEPEATTTFTKQFQNLKGETRDEYIQSLETAYRNSTTEALSIKTRLDDATKALNNSGQQNNQTEQNIPADPTFQAINSNPDVQYAKTLRDRDMVSAFDEFTKEYPNARDPEDFDRFQKASTGVYQAFEASRGRTPTFTELYTGIANILDWKPITNTAKKDATIKNATASQQTVSSTQPQSKGPKVSEEEINAYMAMYPNADRAKVAKELAEVK